MPNFYHILYLSSAKLPLTLEQIDTLLAAARRNNERDGITGMLLYLDGNFIQYFEGEKRVVEAMFKRIAANPLHKVVCVLDEGFDNERMFDNWFMGFEHIIPDNEQDANLFELSRQGISDHVDGCRSALVQVFMHRFYDTNNSRQRPIW